MTQVYVGEDNMESRDDIVECLNGFADVFGDKTIRCFNAHAGRFFKHSLNRDSLYIIFWNNSRGIDITPEFSMNFNRILDVELARNQKDGCRAGVDDPALLLFTESGHPYVELEFLNDKNTIVVYILFDLPHANESYELLQRIMTEVARKLGKEVAPRDMSDSAKKKLIGRYKTFLKAGLTSASNEIERQIRQVQVRRTEFSRDLVNLYSQEVELASRLNALRNTDILTAEKIEKELDKLFSHPKVAKIDVMRGIMTVETKPLTYRDSAKQLRDLGAFKITVHPDREPTILRMTIFKNPDGTIRSDDYTQRLSHPHSTGNSGNMCWGNIGPGIIQLVLDKEFFTLIDLVVHFLENVNEGDVYGRRIEAWPIIPEEGTPAIVTTPAPARRVRIRHV